MLLVTGMSHHTADMLSMFSQHLHKLRSNYSSFKCGTLSLTLPSYYAGNQTPLKATVLFSSGFPLFSICTGITLYDRYTLTPTAWRKDNPEGDSCTPPNLAWRIWMLHLCSFYSGEGKCFSGALRPTW